VISACGACRQSDPKAHAPLFGWSMTLRELALPLSVAVVLVVVLPARVPLPAGVFKTTPVPIGIAYPPTRTAVNCVFAVFRLPPTSVPVVVAANPHAMIAVCVAALVAVSKRY